MKYHYETERGWLAYWFHGTSFWQTWRVAFRFIGAGLRLGLTGHAFVVLPHEEK